MKKLIMITIAAMSMIAFADVNTNAINEAVATTNATGLARLVNTGAILFNDAFSKTETAHWPTSKQVKFTVYSAVKMDPAFITTLFTKANVASINDPVYLYDVCSILDKNGFYGTPERNALRSQFMSVRPSWGCTAYGYKELSNDDITNVVAAIKTDPCFGYNVIALSRKMFAKGLDFSNVYRTDAWNNMDKNQLLNNICLPLFSTEIRNESIAIVISDWYNAFVKNDLMRTAKFNAWVLERVLKNLKTLDNIRGNKNATLSAYNTLKELKCNESALFNTACYLDNDEILNIAIATTGNLTPADVNKFIEVVNAFDIDYKSAEVLKALKTINQRYTLKLYEDRDTWEPILSKIRALIDTRQ